MVGRAVPFVGTGGLRIRSLSRDGIELELPLRRKVANHLGSVHAAATALLVESAGGLAFAMHLPAARTPVVKRMEIAYRRVAVGALVARAAVPASALPRLRVEARGELVIPVEVRDDQGSDLVDCRMVYAWFTRESADA
jgi:uncharacterized protein (TIGR00369 family)